MIKETGSSNKPGARDVCGARRGTAGQGGRRGLYIYKENHIMALINTSDAAEICQEIIYHSQEICTKFNLVIPVLLTGVG